MLKSAYRALKGFAIRNKAITTGRAKMSVMRLNEFKALPGKFEELVSLFKMIVPQIRTVEGNAHCELLLKVADGADDDDRLIVLEVWTSIAAHRRSVAAIDPKDLAAVMPLLSGKPSGRYYTAIEDERE